MQRSSGFRFFAVSTLVLASCKFTGSAAIDGSPGPVDALLDDATFDGSALDSAPLVPWALPSYSHRRRLVVKAVDVVDNLVSVSFVQDTRNVAVQADGDDWRVAFAPAGADAKEIDRWIDDVGGKIKTQSTKTWFRLQRSIVANASDDAYWVYYHDSAATRREHDLSKVFVFGDDFENTASKFSNNGRGETLVQGTDPTTGRFARIDFNGMSNNDSQVNSGLHADVVLPANREYVASHRARRNGDNTSISHYRLSRLPFSARPKTDQLGSDIAAQSTISQRNSGNSPIRIIAVGDSQVNWLNDVDNRWHQFEIRHDIMSGAMHPAIDGVTSPLSPIIDRNTDRSAAIASIGIESFGDGDSVTLDVDNYFIRAFVASPPMVSVGAEENRP